ncbi:MAG: Cof-type HAD-IIB family hydrolase [Dorea sp.]|nr:Cof-type HAD-IIB family hydrolase [Dorea sp.]
MKKIVFLNLNGTLKEFGESVPQASVEAVNGARSKGHEVCLCTGRTFQQISQDILDIGFDGVIANNGGHIQYHGDLVRQKFFTQLAFINMMQNLLQMGAVAVAIAKNEYYVIKANMIRFRDVQKNVASKAIVDEMFPSEVRSVESIMDMPQVEKLLVIMTDRVGRMMQSRWSYAFRIREVHPLVDDLMIGEITPIEISPVKAVKKILELGDFLQEDVIAFGDGANDIEMMEYAGMAVAIEGSADDVLAVADLTTQKPDDGGIKNAFIYLGLMDAD